MRLKGLWLAIFLTALATAWGYPVKAAQGAAVRAPARAVMPFLIYYGWIPHRPGPFWRLARAMRGYPVVVLGSGDEWPSSGDAGPTARLIRAMPAVAFYGYVNIGVTDGQPHHSFAVMQKDFQAWHAMGATGVLLDCAGPDYGVTPERLARAVAMAHQADLRVLVNAFEPRAVLAAGLHSGDAWLAENWVVAGGEPDARTQGFDWSALRILKRRGTAIWMTATAAGPPNRSWVNRWVPETERLVGGSAIAVAGPDYSSRSNAVVPAGWLIHP